MKNAIRCYNQSLWFNNQFFYDRFQKFGKLVKNILYKSLQFKEAMEFIEKKIFYYDRILALIKIQKFTDAKSPKRPMENILIIIILIRKNIKT